MQRKCGHNRTKSPKKLIFTHRRQQISLAYWEFAMHWIQISLLANWFIVKLILFSNWLSSALVHVLGVLVFQFAPHSIVFWLMHVYFTNQKVILNISAIRKFHWRFRQSESSTENLFPKLRCNLILGQITYEYCLFRLDKNTNNPLTTLHVGACICLQQL